LEQQLDILDQGYLNWLYQRYFENTGNHLTLEKGDILLAQNQKNTRLFLVVKGKLVGYRDNGSGQMQEILRSSAGMFAGVHSFFSKTYKSYAEIFAQEKTELAYIDAELFSEEELTRIGQDFVPVIVNELTSRQLLMQQVMIEKENAMKNLMQTEKMATLGQMAAGLAHELNNAIGVLKGNSEWLSDSIKKLLLTVDNQLSHDTFIHAVEQGQTISSSEARDKRESIEQILNVPSSLAKKLARLNLDDKTIKKSKNKTGQEWEKTYQLWEIGATLHDLLVAANHAGHVLNSVKQLAVAQQDRKEVDINQSIEESLILLKSLIRRVHVEKAFGEIPNIQGNNGELVQIWVNIIKNGCESMLSSKTPEPVLHVTTKKHRQNIIIKITDNGPGIPEHLKKKIFQPNVTTKKGGLSFGLGLGLSIVQRLVESYQGKIQVSSVPGNTTFTISLPINQ